MRSTLVAAGIHKSFAHQPEPDFNLDYSHADHDVGALASALGRARFGRLCFYGPPGTGKTAYARHLARHLGMPLLEKKASDLLDAFVGQTEQNLAAAFLQAHKENAILLIDEADSFLMDRNQAQMRWEVSQTNELLCQMEAYNGLFIATTNRFDELDSAALRRFDIKVRFRCLMPQQVWLWFCHFLQQTTEELTAYRNRVLALEDVTPGLFAIATRRQALYGQALHAQALFDLLQAESAHQRGWGERRPIGFTPG